MMYYYIHNNEFITSDVELEEEIGELNYLDYFDGKYILLNEDLVKYMQDNPNASPLEVFKMSPIANETNYGRAISPVINWYAENVEKVIINGKSYLLFDWGQLLREAMVYKLSGRQKMIFYVNQDKFEGNTEDVYNFAINLGVFNCDLDRIREKHFSYLESNLDKVDTYDYTEGVPEVLNVTFTKL